eukprot:90572-Rhodomonas_salina.8
MGYAAARSRCGSRESFEVRIPLHACYAISGTDLAYGATRCSQLRSIDLRENKIGIQVCRSTVASFCVVRYAVYQVPEILLSAFGLAMRCLVLMQRMVLSGGCEIVR